jgi:hypothetical protein
MRAALSTIAANGPTGEPEFVSGTGNEDDAREQGAATASWYDANIARKVLRDTAVVAYFR